MMLAITMVAGMVFGQGQLADFEYRLQQSPTIKAMQADIANLKTMLYKPQTQAAPVQAPAAVAAPAEAVAPTYIYPPNTTGYIVDGRFVTSAPSYSNGSCYIDENGNKQCGQPQQKQRRGLFGRRR